jgi:hypothetical protein
VFNHKPMLPDSGVHLLLGYRTKEDYIASVISSLKGNGKDARTLRAVIRHCLHADGMDPDRTEATAADGGETPAKKNRNDRKHK